MQPILILGWKPSIDCVAVLISEPRRVNDRCLIHVTNWLRMQTSPAASSLLLDGRAGDGSVRTKDTAVADFWPEHVIVDSRMIETMHCNYGSIFGRRPDAF